MKKIFGTEDDEITQLGPEDCAIILRADGKEDLLIPRRDPEDLLQDGAPEIKLLVITYMLHDEKLFNEIASRVFRVLDEDKGGKE